MRILFIIIFIIPTFIWSQKSIAEYNIKLAEDNFFFKGKLYFDDSASAFVSKQNDANEWKIKKESGGEYLSEQVYTDSIGHTIKTIIGNPILEVRDFCKLGEPLLYQDKVSHQWKLHNEVQTIGNFKCHKATTKFRGRKYEVWYTTEIPVNFGPWKFNGLPGLILRVNDKSKEVLIELTKLSLNNSNTAIQLKNGTENLVNHSDFILCTEEAWEKSLEATIAKFAKLQAKFPSLEVDLDITEKIIATELKID